MIFNHFCPESDDSYHRFSVEEDYDDQWLECDFCEEVLYMYDLLHLVNAASALTGHRARVSAGLLRHMVGESASPHEKALQEYADRLLTDRNNSDNI